MAFEYRIQYAKTIIMGLGENGISKASMDEVNEYFEMSNSYSVESMEDVKRYEEAKGF
ncbi:hypothetical protein QWY14_05305 [Planococcus sp. N028]|uniref:Uncharacterized protein n=2 Tax=Planococcus shixiaomingii TaxID=3058393 RepID=A0ABT8MZX3_9BACL|nr:hypothetical protein [Planococcus sp. N028]